MKKKNEKKVINEDVVPQTQVPELTIAQSVPGINAAKIELSEYVANRGNISRTLMAGFVYEMKDKKILTNTIIGYDKLLQEYKNKPI